MDTTVHYHTVKIRPVSVSGVYRTAKPMRLQYSTYCTRGEIKRKSQVRPKRTVRIPKHSITPAPPPRESTVHVRDEPTAASLQKEKIVYFNTRETGRPGDPNYNRFVPHGWINPEI
jgi:hypothetical protein